MHTPKAIFMIRPMNFGYNAETFDSNSFQNSGIEADSKTILDEFDNMVSRLRDNKIDVLVFDDTPEPAKPDAVFPNNWISTHCDGTVVLYPMLAANRRPEIRPDIMDVLAKQYDINCIIDLSYKSGLGQYLEGTGSLVFDHDNNIIYANESPRTNLTLIKQLKDELGFDVVSFKAVDLNGKDIYHTNVVLSVGEKFVMICAESIEDAIERNMLLKSFEKTGKEIIEISLKQMNEFAGNVFEVYNESDERCLIISNRAYKSLTEEQLSKLNTLVKIVSVDIPSIENIGGGSARCMITGIHLPKLN